MKNISYELIAASLALIIAMPEIMGSNWKEVWLFYYKGLLSWKTVEKSLSKVIKEINRRRIVPEVIIGVGRGGVIAAGMLSNEFIEEVLMEDVKNKKHKTMTPSIQILSINTTIFMRTDSGNRRIEEIKVNMDNDINLVDKTILVVVAQTYTGQTLREAVHLLTERGIQRENITTVSLFKYKHKRNLRPEIVHEPDIFGEEVSAEKTVPWKNADLNTDRY